MITHTGRILHHLRPRRLVIKCLESGKFDLEFIRSHLKSRLFLGLAMDITSQTADPLSPRANAFSIASLISPSDREGDEDELTAGTGGVVCQDSSVASLQALHEAQNGNGDWGLRYNNDYHNMEGKIR